MNKMSDKRDTPFLVVLISPSTQPLLLINGNQLMQITQAYLSILLKSNMILIPLTYFLRILSHLKIL